MEVKNVQQKTPVSLVQEYCVRNCMIPQYDLIVNGTGTHDPIFQYQLTFGEVCTIGTGKSKKEAKHDAAKLALLKLAPDGNEQEKDGVINNTDVDFIQDNIQDGITSPYHDALKENTIGALGALCLTNNLPLPVYTLVGEEGPPHAKQFTFECAIIASKVKATSRTKQQAKHLSAKQMLIKLAPFFKEVADTETNGTKETKETDQVDKADECARMIEAYMSQRSAKVAKNLGKKISDYHKIGQEDPFFTNNPNIEKLQQELSGDKLIDLLYSLTEGTENSFTLKEILSRNDWSVNVLELDTVPPIVVMGTAKDSDSAKDFAVRKMLAILRLMLPK